MWGYNTIVCDAITIVMTHPIFESLSNRAPFGLMKASPVWSRPECTRPVVPRHIGRMRRLADAFSLQVPPRLTSPLVVILPDKSIDPEKLMGANTLVSLIEIVHAILIRTEEAINSGASEETITASSQ